MSGTIPSNATYTAAPVKPVGAASSPGPSPVANPPATVVARAVTSPTREGLTPLPEGYLNVPGKTGADAMAHQTACRETGVDPVTCQRTWNMGAESSRYKPDLADRIQGAVEGAQLAILPAMMRARELLNRITP